MSTPETIVVVITTVETELDADSLAATLVQRSLAACVQIEGPITSHYRWQGNQERGQEYRLMIKTTAAVWPTLKETLPQLHPYDEPEIIMLSTEDSAEGYRAWVGRSLKGEE